MNAKEVRALYFGADLGSEPLVFSRMDDGAVDWSMAEDVLLPEDMLPEIDGWCVFDGKVRKPTAEEDPTGAFDVWWDGQMRPATLEEITTFFGLTAPPSPAKEHSGTPVMEERK